MSGTQSRKRTLLFYIIFFTLLVLITLILGEISVRIIQQFGPSTFMFRQFDGVLGASLIPNSEGIHRKCFNGYVSINQHGMRDKERSLKKEDGVYRIGVFSDSLIEAVHVKPEETATYILDDKLNNSNLCKGKCEVLNFSVGGYATLQNFLRYKTLGSKFDLDLVVLVFTDNDLPVLEYNTSTTTDSTSKNKKHHVVGNLYPTPVLQEIAGNIQIINPEKPPFTDEMTFAFKHSSLFYFLYKSVNALFGDHSWSIQKVTPDWAKARPNALFLDPDNPIATNAWQRTKTVLDMFVAETEKNSSKFMIIHWGYDAGSNPWYKPLPDRNMLPKNFNPVFASEWFANYARENNIHVYNLGKDLGEYVRVNKLPPPYLSFTCDMHFNPKGQAVIADFIFNALSHHKIIEN